MNHKCCAAAGTAAAALLSSSTWLSNLISSSSHCYDAAPLAPGSTRACFMYCLFFKVPSGLPADGGGGGGSRNADVSHPLLYIFGFELLFDWQRREEHKVSSGENTNRTRYFLPAVCVYI